MQSEEYKKRYDFQEWRRKVYKSMKKNGWYKRKSKPENAFYDFLSLSFNTNDIERIKIIKFDNKHRWEIDFYIKSIDTYVQFDGIYWHALDKQIEIIRESTKKQDVQRCKAYTRDRAQDEWFVQNNLKLVRITDVEFSKASKNNNLSIIISKIYGTESSKL